MIFKITIYEGNKNDSYTMEAENYDDAYIYCLKCGYDRFLVTRAEKEEKENV